MLMFVYDTTDEESTDFLESWDTLDSVARGYVQQRGKDASSPTDVTPLPSRNTLTSVHSADGPGTPSHDDVTPLSGGRDPKASLTVCNPLFDEPGDEHSKEEATG